MTVQELIDLLKDQTHSAVTGQEREVNLIVNGDFLSNVDLKIVGSEFGYRRASIDLEVQNESP